MSETAQLCRDQFHQWYYEMGVWQRTTFLGVPCLKYATDMWSYQEIISALRPTLVVEFGTYCGGSALYYATMLQAVNPHGLVLTVDTDRSRVAAVVKAHPLIEVMTCSSLDAAVRARIRQLRAQAPGLVFAILDSAHQMAHVLAEMESLRDVLKGGDYLVVEDGIVNGHPVLPDFGDGPMEAIAAYRERHPSDYVADPVRELKFGLTAAPDGFLVRQ